MHAYLSYDLPQSHSSKRDPCVAVEVAYTIHPLTIVASFWAVLEALEVLSFSKDVRSACDSPANLPHVKERLPADSHTYRGPFN